MGFKSLFKNSWYVRCCQMPVRKNTILLESTNGADVGNNMLRIMEELSKPEYKKYEIRLSCNKGVLPRAEGLLKTYRLQNVKTVVCNSFQYYKLLATAGYLFTDSTFPRRFIKREGQTYVNTWHGTPLKKMGKDVPGGAHVIGNIQRNFLMCDYLCLPNPYTKEIFRKAYNLENLFSGKYVFAGYPRNQAFFEEERQNEVKKLLGAEEKRLYCYMPTWRGTSVSQTKEERQLQADVLKEYLQKLDMAMNDSELMMIRLHPFVGPLISCEEFKHIRYMPQEMDPYEILAAADCLVTDYSSVFYDYANKKQGKIVLFLYDREKYECERDIYGEISDLPFPVTETTEGLLEELRSPKNYEDADFLREYCFYDGKNAAKNICSLVFHGEIPKEISIEKEEPNGRKNILFYPGGLQRKGFTTAYLNLMENIDRDAYNYYAAFQESYVENNPERVEIIPDFVQIMPMSKGWFLTFREALASALFYKCNIENGFTRKYLHRFYEREYRRNFGFADMEWCIHYSGYERKMIGLFQAAPVKRGIFVHSDMLMQIQTSHNQHLLTLKQAYREYDFTAAVSEDIYQSTLPICGENPKLCVVDNCHAYKKVLERAEEEFAFDDTTTCTCTKEELEKILRKPCRKFISVGRFSAEKRHDMLLDAFARYHKENQDTMLLIVGGGGNLYEKTWEHVENMGLTENVVLLRSIANPMPIMKACDLFLLTSQYEGQPLVLMEADTLGLPVISTDVTGSGNFMRRFGGYLVPYSEDGVYEGMKAFDRGEVPVMNIDFEGYNRKAVKDFLELLK